MMATTPRTFAENQEWIDAAWYDRFLRDRPRYRELHLSVWRLELRLRWQR